MVPKTPNEKLNFVLDYIKQQRSYNDLHREIDDHANFKGQFAPGEIDLIMDKLRDDGYIDYVAGQQINKTMRASDGLDMRRNFNGTVFITNGGYVQEAIDIRKRKVFEAVYTYAVGIGTALAGVYGLVEIVKSISSWCASSCH